MTNNTQLVQWFFRVLTAGMHADPKIGLDLLLVQSVINQSIYLTVATTGIARRVPCTLLAFKSLDATGTESPTTHSFLSLPWKNLRSPLSKLNAWRQVLQRPYLKDLYFQNQSH